MIRRLAHLCFLTDRLDAMVAFYRDALGLPVQFEFRNQQDQVFGYYVACGDSSFIELFDRVLSSRHWGGEPKDLTKGTQYAHFCLEVTGLKDLRDTLIARGLKVTELRRGMDRSWQAWTSDPDGNAIELMEYTSESLEIQRAPGLVAR